MGRLGKVFEVAKQEGRLAFMPYLTAGYPDLAATADLMRVCAECGCDVIELGIPFSDPLADGPTIQMSSKSALDGGVTPAAVIDMVGRIRDEVDCAIVAMTYVNPVHSMGYREFASAAAGAGFDGIIVPDLPPEEGGEIYSACRENGLDNILLVAPTSPDERIRLAASAGTGFLYCVSLTGVTGARSALSDAVRPFLERVKRLSALPLALGFGISTPEHVREVADLVEGVIVGSAIVDVIHASAGRDRRQIVSDVRDFIGPLVSAARDRT